MTITNDQRSARWCRGLVVSVVVVGVLVAVWVIRNISAATSGWVEVAHGSRHGVFWRLDVAERDGTLCMRLTGRGGPRNGFSADCGFNDEPRGASFYYMTGLGPADMDANYGPLPSAATRIQVAAKLIFPTHALPDAVASGRWWFQLVPRNGPLPPRFGHVLQRPRPLDDDGNPVPWQEF